MIQFLDFHFNKLIIHSAKADLSKTDLKGSILMNPEARGNTVKCIRGVPDTLLVILWSAWFFWEHKEYVIIHYR